MLPISSRPSSSTLFYDASSESLADNEAHEPSDRFVWVGPRREQNFALAPKPSHAEPETAGPAVPSLAESTRGILRAPASHLAGGIVLGLVVIEVAAASFCGTSRATCPAWAATLASAHVSTVALPVAASLTLLALIAGRLAQAHVEAGRRSEQWLDGVRELDEPAAADGAVPL